MFEQLKRWRAQEPTGTTPVEIAYSDQRTAQVEALRRDLADARRALAQEETRWAILKTRDDPEAHELRNHGAPKLIDLRQQIARATTSIATLETAIAATTTEVAQYAALTDREAQWLQSVLDRLPTEAEVRHAYEASRQIDTTAADLLRVTGDRGFRKPRCDPRTQLLAALDATVRRMAKLRLLRSAVAQEQTGS